MRVLLAMRSRADDASVVTKQLLLITLFFEGEVFCRRASQLWD